MYYTKQPERGRARYLESEWKKGLSRRRSTTLGELVTKEGNCGTTVKVWKQVPGTFPKHPWSFRSGEALEAGVGIKLATSMRTLGLVDGDRL